MSELNQATAASQLKTVFCIALEGQTAGGVDWFPDAAVRNQQPRESDHVRFDLDVPANATAAEIDDLADQAAWNKFYNDDRPDCRLAEPLKLFNVTLDWEPGDDEQGDYATSVRAINHDDAIRRVAEEMADSGEVVHNSDADRQQYIQRVIDGAGQYAAELVEDTLAYDLENLLKDRPDALARIKAILDEKETPVVAANLPDNTVDADHMVVVPASSLSLLIDMSRSHVDDVESGIRDGDYVAADNTDLPEKQTAVATIEQLCDAAIKGHRVPVGENPYATLTEICESLDGLGQPITPETVDGDKVNWISRALYFAEVALGRRARFASA